MLESFAIFELASALVVVLGAVGGVIQILEQSRCRTISCCAGLWKCDRDVPPAAADHGDGDGDGGEAR